MNAAPRAPAAGIPDNRRARDRSVILPPGAR
jgi:hypothetical protein